MVKPMYGTKFRIGVKGTASQSPEDMKTISNVESLSISWDDGVEEWHPFEEGGYVKRLKTAKSCSISMTCKRDGEDEGNNYLAAIAFKNGNDAETKFEIDLADGAKMKMNCVVNVTSMGGDSTAVDAMEVEVLSSGMITYEAAPTHEVVSASVKSK